MSSGRLFIPIVLGFGSMAFVCGLNISADETGKSRAVAGEGPMKAGESQAAMPGVATDFNQLPAGKVIGIAPGDVKILKALDEPAEFSLIDRELGEFVKQIEQKHKINVTLDVAALKADGKGTETILNRKTSGTTLRSALHLFLDDHGLTFLVRHETLVITTKTAAEVVTPVRIYQVHDLTFLPNDPSLQFRFDGLRDLIQAMIAPDSWREHGGTQGEIRGFEGPGLAVLVIMQTDEVHEQIESLLTDLRAAKLPTLLEMQKKRPPPPPVPSATPQVPGVPRLPVGAFGGFIGAGAS